MDKIASNLYLGGVSAAFDERTYRDHKVTHVLTIMQRQVYFVRKMTSLKKKFDVSHSTYFFIGFHTHISSIKSIFNLHICISIVALYH